MVDLPAKGRQGLKLFFYDISMTITSNEFMSTLSWSYYFILICVLEYFNDKYIIIDNK